MLGTRVLRHAARRLTAPRWFSLPSHDVVGLPALSPTMEQGTIAKWNVEEGAAFGAGDVICEIETDKATVDFEAQDDGVLAKYLQPAGAEVAGGAPIMVVVEEAADAGAFSDFEAPAAAAVPPPAPAAAPAEEKAPAAPAPAAPAPPPAAAPAVATGAAPPPVAGASHIFVRADADLPLVRGPLAATREAQKDSYHEQYGATGF